MPQVMLHAVNPGVWQDTVMPGVKQGAMLAGCLSRALS